MTEACFVFRYLESLSEANRPTRRRRDMWHFDDVLPGGSCNRIYTPPFAEAAAATAADCHVHLCHPALRIFDINCPSVVFSDRDRQFGRSSEMIRKPGATAGGEGKRCDGGISGRSEAKMTTERVYMIRPPTIANSVLGCPRGRRNCGY